MSILESLLYGVFAGVITSALLFIVSKIFSALVIPWYQNIVYRGIRTDGAWTARAGDMNQSLHLLLHQAASRISGSATLVSDSPRSEDKYEAVRSFTVVGAIRDRFVELSLRHDSQQRLGACCLLLEVVGDGRTMNGVFSFYSVVSHSIDFVEITVDRLGLVRPPNPQQELPLGLSRQPDEMKRKTPKKPNQTPQPMTRSEPDRRDKADDAARHG